MSFSLDFFPTILPFLLIFYFPSSCTRILIFTLRNLSLDQGLALYTALAVCLRLLILIEFLKMYYIIHCIFVTILYIIERNFSIKLLEPFLAEDLA